MWAVDKPLNPSLARDIIEVSAPKCAAWSVRGISLVVIAGSDQSVNDKDTLKAGN